MGREVKPIASEIIADRQSVFAFPSQSFLINA
jgi:hypothetical protein